MPLPDGFSEWEHLQNTVRRVHNDAVRDFYRSQPDNDIGTARSSAKHACLMKDNDTSTMTVLRFWLFWVVCRKMRDNFEPYRDPFVEEPDTAVLHKPRITCYFLEEAQDIEPGYRPVEGVLSIRIVDEESSTLTDAKLSALANKINLAFGQNNGFLWRKGKDLYSYADLKQGFRFKVLARNQSDATEIIQKAVGIVGKTYNAKFFKKNEAIDANAAFPTVPGTQILLGKTVKIPRRRPIADVRFIYASIKIWGLPKPIILVDKTGYWEKAIIKP